MFDVIYIFFDYVMYITIQHCKMNNVLNQSLGPCCMHMAWCKCFADFQQAINGGCRQVCVLFIQVIQALVFAFKLSQSQHFLIISSLLLVKASLVNFPMAKVKERLKFFFSFLFFQINRVINSFFFCPSFSSDKFEANQNQLSA